MLITNAKFGNFKALGDLSISLRHTNVLVGPNNAGKSTILDGFRALEGALRYARRRKPTWVADESGKPTRGYKIPIAVLPISLENIQTNYRNVNAVIEFRLGNKNRLKLIFKEEGGCTLCLNERVTESVTTRDFSLNFPIDLVSVPTLAPFEEEESLVTDKYFDRWAKSRRSHRLFRNIWRRNLNDFQEFKMLVEETWPGMSILPPEIEYETKRLTMFCKEGRIDREVYWAGFGFQVWLQFLTHILDIGPKTLLIVDEPDIYLHPDLQHQLFHLVRDRTEQTLLATHSVEIINEANHDEVILVDKTKKKAERVNDLSGLQHAISFIGSAQNVHLSRLARGKKVLFFEGQDFKILRRIAATCGQKALASATDLVVLPIGGFSQWRKVEDAAWTFEKLLETNIKIGALFDRDYRSQEEIDEFLNKIRKTVPVTFVLDRKEIENYLLHSVVLSRSVQQRLKQSGKSSKFNERLAETLLYKSTNQFKG